MPILSLREALAGRVADPWQTIPSDWVRAAQRRWTEQPPKDVGLPAVGCDPLTARIRSADVERIVRDVLHRLHGQA